jgi:aryl-alcohol dehydrogenase-like predicted oxidoreductase
MKYRFIGNSGISVSEIGFGTGDNGGALIYGSPQLQRTIVGAALENGINFFDTSPDYGKGLAEANLGRVLGEVGDPDVVICTKVEVMPEHLGMISLRVQESINDSLMRLRRDHVDIVMMHNPVSPARIPGQRIPWTPLTAEDLIGPALEGFLKAKADGKVRLLGLACEQASVGAVGRVLDTGAFDMINVWFNLANPTAKYETAIRGIPEIEQYPGMFAMAREHRVGIAVIRPVAGGALTDAVVAKGHDGRHELSGGYYSWHPEILRPEIARGRKLAFLSRPGQTLASAAYRYILGQPEVTTVIGGFSDVAHFADALSAVDAGPPDDADAAAVEELYMRGGLTDNG